MPEVRPRRSSRHDRLSVDRIVEAALEIVETDGFDALTMRRVAGALETGPASLYAHVRNKAELDDLLIGRLCSRVVLPEPDAHHWHAQILDVCRQLRDQFLHYPGISRAALAATPTSLDTLRISEGMLAIVLAGSIPPQAAAWAIDAAYLYVSAYSLESSLRTREQVDGRVLDRAETIARLTSLPADRFPHTVTHAEHLASGEGHDRFDFTVQTLFQGLGS